MSDLYILRDKFIDRVLTIDELTAMVEMLRGWYDIAAKDSSERGEIHLEAHLYAFPRQAKEGILQSLAAVISGSEFRADDVDRLIAIGPRQSAMKRIDVSVWREVLVNPDVQSACVLLRVTFEGPMQTLGKYHGPGISTFVLCGQPQNGALLLKTIWRLGADESIEPVFVYSRWTEERLMMKMFDQYLAECGAGRRDLAAEITLQKWGKRRQRLFVARHDEQRIIGLTKLLVEIPGEAGTLKFIGRVATPTLIGSGFIAVALVYRKSLFMSAIGFVVGTWLLTVALFVVWRKIRKIFRFYHRMRQTFEKIYSGPIYCKQINVSLDRTPTLVKCSRELELLGATHICDFSITSAKSVMDSNRFYVRGDTTIAVGLLKATDQFQIFPPRPIIIATTRFVDGSVHGTVNRPQYRKLRRPKTTYRCLIENGFAGEVLALHREHVDKMIAAGAIPKPSPSTAVAMMEQTKDDHEEARDLWRIWPYSWSDAFHDAFKICRREYLTD